MVDEFVSPSRLTGRTPRGKVGGSGVHSEFLLDDDQERCSRISYGEETLRKTEDMLDRLSCVSIGSQHA